MELINGNSEIIKDFFQSMERMLDSISRLAKESRPHLNGEKFLSNREASNYLKVSIRTLQEWRDTGVIPYIQIKGKIIYRESDIERLLQTYYNKCKHSKKCTFYTLRFGCSFAAVNTIKPQLL